MSMIVQHNLVSMNANRNLGVSCGNLAKSTEKLSSGYKINRAGDNAAGLAISEKMRGQIRGLNQASANSEDGISMIQTAEGALTETHSILQRMRELAVQAASDTNTDDDRTQIQNEIDQLTQEVDRIATTTEFNTKKLLDGSRQGSVTEKAGKASVEGTFGNSNVSAEIENHAEKAAFTDVIRVEITKDFGDGYSNIDGASVNDYEDLAEDLATSNAAVDKLQTFTNFTGTGKLEDSLVTDYIDATKKVLTGDGEAYTAQTTAWGNIMTAVGTAVLATGETLQLGGVPLTSSSTAANVMSALKDELDKIAQMEVEMETNETYQKIGAIEVEDVESPGNTKTLSAIISDNTARSSAYATAVEKAENGGGWYLSASGVDTAAADYKTAFQNALKSGKTIDEAKEDEKVVEAREALYGKFATDLKNTTGALGGNITVGNTALTTANKVSEAAAEAFDTICEAAEELAATELMKEEAFKDAEGEVAFAVTDLFGNSKNQDVFEIASGLDAENNLKITLKNKEGEDTVITIANADKLLAGDVITITSEKMTETKSAATGKEAFRLQVGANAGQEVSLGINSMRAKDLDIVQTKLGVEGKALDVSSQATASLAVNAYDMAIQKVSTERAKMGAMQNRLEHTIANLDASAENLQAAESSLRDTDMAEEMTQYSKNNILMQAGQSMLAQANQSNQGVLSLLG